MRVSDVMSRHVEFIEADAPVQEAAVLMGELDVGALPVGAPERLEGVLTDRDVLYRVVARGLDCAAVRVRDVLTTPVLSCRPEDDLRSAMDLMAANHVRRLPVRDGAGRVVGWVTLADISRRLLLDSGSLQAALREATEGVSKAEAATANSAG
ncbi:MAG: CBS domain-containing protein [Acetobacteraceae bacterium]|nr:CBS domain-containing protein [Acetobacteraceae bacterium]